MRRSIVLRTLSPMIDSSSALTEPELRDDSSSLALDCYVSAIRNIAHYAADLEPELTGPYRKYLEELAVDVACGACELEESRASLRALLREYRDKTSQYLNILREDLNAAALALAEILDSLGDTDGEQGDQIREALRTLREPPGDDCDSIRDTVSVAAKTVENCLAAVRKRHQLSVSQLMIEIRMLHKRIDALESAAAVDMLTHLFPRQEMEQRIREGQLCRLLLIRAGGIVTAAAEFGCAVAEELTGAVIRRLRNALPSATVIARWSGHGFAAMLDLNVVDAEQLALRMAASLSGQYACVKDGKAVHPPVQPEVRLLESVPGGAEEALRQAEEFLAE
jgi:GGDEF domain-containing protein